MAVVPAFFFPPASTVEVIESVLSVCLSVCLLGCFVMSHRHLTSQNDVISSNRCVFFLIWLFSCYGSGPICGQKLQLLLLSFGQKDFKNVWCRRCMNAQAFSLNNDVRMKMSTSSNKDSWISIIIKHVLLAVAQSQRLLGAPISLSHMMKKKEKQQEKQ